MNKSVMNSISSYLEDVKDKDVNFDGEILTFTLQKFKRYFQTSRSFN